MWELLQQDDKFVRFSLKYYDDVTSRQNFKETFFEESNAKYDCRRMLSGDIL